MILGEGLFILRREIVCEVGMAQYGINKQKTGTIITDLKLNLYGNEVEVSGAFISIY